MELYKRNLGIVYTVFAYIIWGFLPIYWKLIEHVPPGEILAHRIVWAFILMFAIVLLTNNWNEFIRECRVIIADKSKLIGITLASFTISVNWFVYIWAVNNDFVVQASLGYYINPLISILLGIIVLKETVTNRQILAIIIASIGVIYLTFSFGVFPWISLLLATSFAAYGLLKKTVDVGAMFGLTIETFIVTPIAIIYLLSLPTPSFTFSSGVSSTVLLLMGAGIMTAVPLLLFALGAREIPLSMLGFLQYIAPTIMLLLGVLLYKEAFTMAHLIAFVFIWTALAIFMSASFQKSGKQKKLDY